MFHDTADFCWFENSAIFVPTERNHRESWISSSPRSSTGLNCSSPLSISQVRSFPNQTMRWPFFESFHSILDNLTHIISLPPIDTTTTSRCSLKGSLSSSIWRRQSFSHQSGALSIRGFLVIPLPLLSVLNSYPVDDARHIHGPLIMAVQELSYFSNSVEMRYTPFGLTFHGTVRF